MSEESPYPIAMTAKEASDNWLGGVEYYFDCVTNGNFDSGWQSSGVYDTSGFEPDTEYGYRVKVKDKKCIDHHFSRNDPNYFKGTCDGNDTNDPNAPNKTDWSLISYIIAGGPVVDTTPPVPDPMTWSDPAYAASPNTVTLFATTATDISGVVYYFEDYNNPAQNSGWVDEPNYTFTGLDPNATYLYRVKAKDNSPLRNETGWSEVVYAITLTEGEVEDTMPPEPDPAEWEISPYEIWGGGGAFDYSVTMTAVQATDDNYDVEYYFDCTTNSSFDSGWQNADTHEEPQTYTVWVGGSGQYHRFRVKTRDTSPNQNETGWSTELPAMP